MDHSFRTGRIFSWLLEEMIVHYWKCVVCEYQNFNILTPNELVGLQSNLHSMWEWIFSVLYKMFFWPDTTKQKYLLFSVSLFLRSRGWNYLQNPISRLRLPIDQTLLKTIFCTKPFVLLKILNPKEMSGDLEKMISDLNFSFSLLIRETIWNILCKWWILFWIIQIKWLTWWIDKTNYSLYSWWFRRLVSVSFRFNPVKKISVNISNTKLLEYVCCLINLQHLYHTMTIPR